MVAKRILITGANRGIGLEFVKQLVQLPEPPELLFVTCRNPDTAKELDDVLKNAHKTKSYVLKLDVCNEDQLQAVADTVIGECGALGLNLLINNAGFMDKNITQLSDITTQNMMAHYMVNTVSPTMLTKALLPALRQAASSVNGDELSVRRAAVVNITTFLASIKEVKKFTINDTTSWYPYRASKAALNMITKCLALDLQTEHILVLPIHPGWVKTDMGGEDAVITAQQSVTGMLQIMRRASAADAGIYVGWDGYVLPW